MPFYKELDDITLDDLQALVDSKTAEDRSIEFKRDLYDQSDASKREFLKDVSALANTVGGHLFIGIAEEEGIARELVGIEGDLDKTQRWLGQLVLSGIQPRLLDFHTRPVPIGNDRHVLVLQVGRSWSPPHRVTAQGSNRFWARNATAIYEPDVDQLRELFQAAPDLAERIRDFRLNRIAKLGAGETVVPLLGTARLAFHILPYSAFERGERLSVGDLMAHVGNLVPIGSSGADWRLNIDGLVTFSGTDPTGVRSFTQIWRTGQIEGVQALRLAPRGGPSLLLASQLEADLVDATLRYLLALRLLNIAPPYALFVSLIGVENVLYRRSYDHDVPDTPPVFDRSQINATEIIIADRLERDDQVPRLLRPIFDELAYASGQLGSANYDSAGNWIRRT